VKGKSAIISSQNFSIIFSTVHCLDARRAFVQTGGHADGLEN
jgi:hypothetical protein